MWLPRFVRDRLALAEARADRAELRFEFLATALETARGDLTVARTQATQVLEENAFLRGELIELDRRATHLQSSFDWMASYINSLTLERAQLLQRAGVLEQPLVPEIAVAPPPAPTGRTIARGPRGLDGFADILNELRERRGAAADAVEDTAAAVSFEDMGDDAAKVAGIDHDREGRVVYKQ